MTDGSKYNIAVYNGLNGTGTGDVLGIHFDLVLPASGWSNGSITVAESRLWPPPSTKYLIEHMKPAVKNTSNAMCVRKTSPRPASSHL